MSSSRPVNETGWKRDRLHLVDVLRGKLDDLTDAVVVEIVDDRDDERNFDTRSSEVLNRTQLHIEQLPTPRCLFFSSLTPSNCK